MAKFIHVVLKLPKSARRLYIYAQVVLKALTGNPSFAAVNLVALTAAILALSKAETAAGHGEPGSAAACASAREAVRQELNHLRDFVQGVLETQVGTIDLTAIRAMVVTAAMDLRKVTARAKLAFGAMYGDVPGSVDLTAPASPRDTHEWQHSADQLNWTAAPATRRAKTTVTGLPIGVAHYFRHRTLTKTGYTPWSDPVAMLVVK
jgi:hypothetical protein